MNKIFTFFIAVATFAAISGCSKDGPSGRVNYGKLRISHMNLSGAVSIGISNNNGTRAIDGEFLSAGMYKIDKDGNIAAVGVYFTTDEQGNRLEHEEVLRVAPKRLYKLCDNFMLATFCEYYDVEGDVVADKWEPIDVQKGKYKLIRQNVPYSHLLIRISDGKIWCVDNVADVILRLDYYEDGDLKRSSWTQDSRGNLYFSRGWYGCYKFNLTDNQPSLQRIDKNGAGLGGDVEQGINILEHDVICTYDYYYYYKSIYFLWPNGGYQYIDDSSTNCYEGEGYFYDEKYRERCASTSVQSWLSYNAENGPVLITSAPVYDSQTYRGVEYEMYWDDAARFYRFNIGAEPGSVTFTEPVVLLRRNNQKGAFGPKSVFETENCFLISGSDYVRGAEFYYLTRLDKTSGEWEWIKQTDKLVTFDDSNMYQGKAWSIFNDDEFGAQWFDPETCEIGFVKFNILLPDYIYSNYYESHIDKGYIMFMGTNPSDGNKTTIRIDITTGEAVWDIDEPSRLFEYIVSLN